MHPVTGGSYWVDPQSLGRVIRAIIISAGNNWVLATALVLIVLFWEKRRLHRLDCECRGPETFCQRSVRWLPSILLGLMGIASAPPRIQRRSSSSMPSRGLYDYGW